MRMTLIIAANVSNVINPRVGFAGSIDMFAGEDLDVSTGSFYDLVNTWLESENVDSPLFVQERIDERLSWQRPKAIMSSVLLVISVVFALFIWRAIRVRARRPDAQWNYARIVFLLHGVAVILVILVLMLMVIGNMQGALAPISLTLFLG